MSETLRIVLVSALPVVPGYFLGFYWFRFLLTPRSKRCHGLFALYCLVVLTAKPIVDYYWQFTVGGRWVAILMGMITGAGGGVFRDIFINVEPLIFRKDIYALACVFGGVVFAVCMELGLPRESATIQIITALSVIVMRCAAMKYHVSLPTLRRDVAEHDEADLPDAQELKKLHHLDEEK